MRCPKKIPGSPRWTLCRRRVPPCLRDCGCCPLVPFSLSVQLITGLLSSLPHLFLLLISGQASTRCPSLVLSIARLGLLIVSSASTDVFFFSFGFEKKLRWPPFI